MRRTICDATICSQPLQNVTRSEHVSGHFKFPAADQRTNQSPKFLFVNRSCVNVNSDTSTIVRKLWVGEMKAIVQRVTSAGVSVEGEVISTIGRGLCVLVGIHRDDTPQQRETLVRKVLNLRIFDDESTGKRYAFFTDFATSRTLEVA